MLSKIVDYFTYHFKKISIYLNNFYSKTVFNPNELFNEVMVANRQFYEEDNEFINLENLGDHRYGLNNTVLANLKNPINNAPLNTELIIYLANSLFNGSLKYFEIGVSFMKNFLSVDNFFTNSKLAGYDINKINPKFKNDFKKISNQLSTSVSKNNNILYYFQGDILSEIDINLFLNSIPIKKFNFVYSDAHHARESILYEIDNLITRILDDDFIIYYDDLHFPGMLDGFNEINNILSLKYKYLFTCTFKINGWIGQNEVPHLNGIISNINLDNYLKPLKLYQYKKINS